jgi:hypothetical protein
VKHGNLRSRTINTNVISTVDPSVAVVPAREKVIEVVEFENGATFHGTLVSCASGERSEAVVAEEAYSRVYASGVEMGASVFFLVVDCAARVWGGETDFMDLMPVEKLPRERYQLLPVERV